MVKLKNLRKKRILAGLSQKELSERARISRSLISDYESGKKNTTPATFLRLVEALGCDAEEILDMD